VGRASTQERTRVERLAGDHAVRATYWGSQADVARFYERADIFVQPSQSEGMSLALLEAMTAGLPCVATDIPGNREALGEGGRLVPPDPHALASAIAELLGDASLRARLGADARRRVSDFSWSGYVKRLRELIERVSLQQTTPSGSGRPNLSRRGAIRPLLERKALNREQAAAFGRRTVKPRIA
jgi:glycosyltransferase involved in cell wall biosynthesis